LPHDSCGFLLAVLAVYTLSTLIGYGRNHRMGKKHMPVPKMKVTTTPLPCYLCACMSRGAPRSSGFQTVLVHFEGIVRMKIKNIEVVRHQRPAPVEHPEKRRPSYIETAPHAFPINLHAEFSRIVARLPAVIHPEFWVR